MTQSDIETFFAILEHPTMTAAARSLFLSQPSLSARLQTLETEVGVTLFSRGKGQRRLELTAEGRRFLPLARRFRNLFQETAAFSSAAHQKLLHIAAVYTANQYFLPQVYEEFLTRTKQISLHVETLRNYEAISYVARSDADFAIVDSLSRYEYRIKSRPLFREEWFLLLSPDSRVSEDPVPPLSLRAEDELLVFWQEEIKQWHNEWFGVDAWPLLYTDIPQLVEQIPLSGERWSVIPASSAPYFSAKNTGYIRRLTCPPAERTFFLITRKDEELSEMARQFLDLLHRNLEKREGIHFIE
ncbi:MAG: LysR family transcriptional regulator [Lachnospiraceae bacterium]|nr:LysR family transcriptional regulator [Lachnospiraceae bacterium]